MRYGKFCLLDLCLHNQRVQDGISRSANICERWNIHIRMGQRKCTSPLQRQRSSWSSKCYEWRHFQHRQDVVRWLALYKSHCLIFAFSRHKRRTRVLDPDRAQPCWRTWPQERPLLKLPNNAIHWINLYTADNTIGFSNTNSLESGDL